MTATTSNKTARFSGIHARLLFLVLAAMVPVIALVAFGARHMIERQRLDTGERAQARAQLTAANLDMELSNLDALLLGLSKVVSLDAADAELNARLFASIEPELDPIYLPFEVHTAAGDRITTGPAGPNVSGQEFFRDAIARRRFVVGRLQRDETTGKWTVTLARPVLDGVGTPIGVISIAIDLARMATLLNTDDLPPQSLITVVNSDNLNLARSRELELIGRPTADRTVIAAAIAARQGSVEFVTTGGMDRLAGYATCKRAPWLVFVRVRTSEAFAAANRELAWISGLVGAVLAASLVLAWVLASRIAQPIRALAAEATAFGDDARRAPVRVEASGEIGALALAFDRMAVAVAQREAALRDADQRFRELVDCTDAILWEADAATLAFTSVSNNAERILGYALADWRQPDFWATHVHADDFARAEAQRAAGARSRREFELEYRFVAKDGRIVWLHDDVKVIEEAGRPRWLRGFLIDVTEMRELEQQLRQSQKLEAIGTLASGIAHDFNNILTGVFGFTELARMSAQGNRVVLRHLDEIARSSQRAADLVRQILAFSRPGAGDEEMGRIQLETVVLDTVKLLRATSPSTVEFATRFAPGLPPVQGNATQLLQVVVNLGTNAVQALHDRAGRVSFELDNGGADEEPARVLPGPRPRGFVRLVVRDNGVGMDAATRERAFEPFFTTKAPGRGTGLGLSVVHGIVRHHQGAIRIESRPNEGTAVEICLPAGTVGEEEGRLLPAPPRGGLGERILVVDDEAVIAETTSLLLRACGYQVESETSPAAALVRLECDPQGFDLVLSDQTMPGLTGLELAQRVRRLRADLPVVLASGYSTALTPENVQAAGVREVIQKPYTTETLLAVLDRQLRRDRPAAAGRDGAIPA